MIHRTLRSLLVAGFAIGSLGALTSTAAADEVSWGLGTNDSDWTLAPDEVSWGLGTNDSDWA